MDILPDPVSFEWDKGNIDKNLRKHNVTNQEAEEVFSCEQIVFFEDEKHSLPKEKRYMVWGTTKNERKLTIICTIRNNMIRIISARDMHKIERRRYGQEIKTDSNI